jgi:hypothetical protein
LCAPRFVNGDAVARVLRLLRRPQPIERLAREYRAITGCSERSSRRAVERLAVRGLIGSAGDGWYYLSS